MSHHQAASPGIQRTIANFSPYYSVLYKSQGKKVFYLNQVGQKLAHFSLYMRI